MTDDTQAPSDAAKKEQHDRNAFLIVLSGLSSTKQALADAAMENATEFKQANEKGYHGQAVKLVLRLDSMSTDKRQDFLRSFDQYRAWMTRWDDEQDMLDRAAAEEREKRAKAEADRKAAEEAKRQVEREEAERKEAEEPALPLAAAEEKPPAATEEPVPEPEADWGPEQVAADDPGLDEAGFTFGAGRAAGQEGQPAEANPHVEKSAAFAVWERGRQRGERIRAVEAEMKERVTPAAGSDVENGGHQGDTNGKTPAPVEPPATAEAPPPRRRRASRGGPAATSLH